MTNVADPQVRPAVDRPAQRRVDKFSARRAELASAALLTLSELGYARTSLREIAQNSPFSHGVLHYYFNDKVDLIIDCVRQYKSECVTRYDHIVESSHSPDELVVGFGDAMAATLRDDARLHRLWYDMRSQSMFEESFRADVLEIDASLQATIWRVISRLSELAAAAPGLAPSVAYAMFDGLFQHALLRHLGGVPDAADELRATVVQLLPTLVLSPAPAL